MITDNENEPCYSGGGIKVMIKQDPSHPLINWYLARLRNNALPEKSRGTKTPRTFVETDSILIKELVQKATPVRAAREQVIYKWLEQRNSLARILHFTLITISLLATIYFVIVAAISF